MAHSDFIVTDSFWECHNWVEFSEVFSYLTILLLSNEFFKPLQARTCFEISGAYLDQTGHYFNRFKRKLVPLISDKDVLFKG